MRVAASSLGASGAHSRARSFALVHRIFSHVVLELRLGVELLRRRGGDHGGRRRRRRASGESGKNGASGKDAKVFGHLRVLPISAGARVMSRAGARFAEKRDWRHFLPPRDIPFAAVGAPSGDHRDRAYMLN
jgi:hypothetical protein